MNAIQMLDFQLNIIVLVIGIIGVIAVGSRIFFDIQEQRRIKKILKGVRK